MTDSEPYEIRELREQAEAQARLERALTRLENGSEGEQRLAAYMRIQLAEDAEADAAAIGWIADPDSDDPPMRRMTTARDRSGLEVAVILLAGNPEGE